MFRNIRKKVDELYALTIQKDKEKCKVDIAEFVKQNADIIENILQAENNPFDLLFQNGRYAAALFLLEEMLKLNKEHVREFQELEDYAEGYLDPKYQIDCYMHNLWNAVAENKEIIEATLFYTDDLILNLYSLANMSSLITLNLDSSFLQFSRFPNMLTILFGSIARNNSIRDLNCSKLDPEIFENDLQFFKQTFKPCFINMLESNTSLLFVSLPPRFTNSIEREEIETAIEIYTKRNQTYVTFEAIQFSLEKIQSLLIGRKDENSLLSVLPIDIMNEIFSQLTLLFMQFPNPQLVNHVKQFYSFRNNQVSFWNICEPKRNEIFIGNKFFEKFKIKIFEINLNLQKNFLSFACHAEQESSVRDILTGTQIFSFRSSSTFFNDSDMQFTIYGIDHKKKFFNLLGIELSQIKKLLAETEIEEVQNVATLGLK